MPKSNNPTDIARETLKQLAARRVAPTPENYQRIYHEIAETPIESNAGIEKELVASLQTIGRTHPQNNATLKSIIQALEQRDWKSFTLNFESLIAQKRTEQSGWADLVRDLIKNWDLKQSGLSTPRKKEALERVLINFGKNPEELLNKLRSLVKAWSEGVSGPPGIGNRSPGDIVRPTG